MAGGPYPGVEMTEAELKKTLNRVCADDPGACENLSGSDSAAYRLGVACGNAEPFGGSQIHAAFRVCAELEQGADGTDPDPDRGYVFNPEDRRLFNAGLGQSR
jgi:hypothetical protein